MMASQLAMRRITLPRLAGGELPAAVSSVAASFFVAFSPLSVASFSAVAPASALASVTSSAAASTSDCFTGK